MSKTPTIGDYDPWPNFMVEVGYIRLNRGKEEVRTLTHYAVVDNENDFYTVVARGIRTACYAHDQTCNIKTLEADQGIRRVVWDHRTPTYGHNYTYKGTYKEIRLFVCVSKNVISYVSDDGEVISYPMSEEDTEDTHEDTA